MTDPVVPISLVLILIVLFFGLAELEDFMKEILMELKNKRDGDENDGYYHPED